MVDFQVQTETHTAMVTDVGGDFAVVVLHSNPITARLNVGQTKEFDVSGSGKPEISITLVGINDGVAQLVFAQIKSPKAAASLTPPKVFNTVKHSYDVQVALGVFLILLCLALVLKYRHSKPTHQ